MKTLHGRGILFIDNNKEALLRLKSLFEPNYDCYFANTGRVGIETFNVVQPPLVVCDVCLADISGFQICQRLKQANPSLRLILLSACNDKATRIKGLNAMADTYIDKALDDDELFLRIANLYPRNTPKSLYSKKAYQVQAPKTLKKALYQLFSQHYVTSNAEKKVDARSIAKELALSLRSLQRKLKEETGLTFTQHHIEYRLKQSTQLLEQGYSCSDITTMLCFSSSAHFAYCFKKRFNITPSRYSHG